jgi:hypothetical protein
LSRDELVASTARLLGYKQVPKPEYYPHYVEVICPDGYYVVGLNTIHYTSSPLSNALVEKDMRESYGVIIT